MLVISPHVVGSVYRSCTKSLLPHFVFILIRRNEIEDMEVSESDLKRVSAGETEIPSRKFRDNAAVGVRNSNASGALQPKQQRQSRLSEDFCQRLTVSQPFQ